LNSSETAEIGFRPVTADDYPLLEGWLKTPHWREWWGEPEVELSYIRDMVEDRDTTRPFVFMVDGLPAGYIQYWFVCDHLEEPWLTKAPWLAQVPADSIGVDMSIGDPANLSRGLGSTVLRAFTERLRAEGHGTIVIDPDISNKRAVRAYEKAGFRPLHVSRESSGGADTEVLIMVHIPESTPDNSETSR
jgi:RimJ/RimL family protein N-acetyltransferase